MMEILGVNWLKPETHLRWRLFFVYRYITLRVISRNIILADFKIKWFRKYLI